MESKIDFTKMKNKAIWKQIGYLAIGTFGASWLLNKSFEAGSDYGVGAVCEELEKIKPRDDE